VCRMTLIFLLVPGRITIHTNCLQAYNGGKVGANIPYIP
jgi:hypothetical protein